MFTYILFPLFLKRTGENKIIGIKLKTNLKQTNMNTEKHNYIAPQIVCIELDNEIALQLESTPPPAPGEGRLHVPEYFNNDPFETNLG